MITTLIVGSAVVGVGVVGAGAVGVGGATALWYKKKKDKKKKKKALARLKKQNAIFGQHLEDLEVLTESGFPIVFESTILSLEGNGIGDFNLFTIKGNTVKVGELAAEFDKGQEPDLFTEEPHVVAQVLLRYLQELPEPLGTHVLYDDFIRMEENEPNLDSWIEGMRNLLLQLPDINLKVMRRLLLFLYNHCIIIEQTFSTPISSSAQSLSPIFSSLLFNTFDTSSERYSITTALQGKLFCKLLENNARIFAPAKGLTSFYNPYGEDSFVSSLTDSSNTSSYNRRSMEFSESDISTVEEASVAYLDLDTATGPDIQFACETVSEHQRNSKRNSFFGSAREQR